MRPPTWSSRPGPGRAGCKATRSSLTARRPRAPRTRAPSSTPYRDASRRPRRRSPPARLARQTRRHGSRPRESRTAPSPGSPPSPFPPLAPLPPAARSDRGRRERARNVPRLTFFFFPFFFEIRIFSTYSARIRQNLIRYYYILQESHHAITPSPDERALLDDSHTRWSGWRSGAGSAPGGSGCACAPRPRARRARRARGALGARGQLRSQGDPAALSPPGVLVCLCVRVSLRLALQV